MNSNFRKLAFSLGTGRPKALTGILIHLLSITLVSSGVFIPGTGRAQDILRDPLSLKETPVPVPMAAVVAAIPPANVQMDFQPLSARIVRDQAALVRLGKALFWDMQVGSDGLTACASCHFNAGADIRSKNSISPGLLDTNFRLGELPGDNTFGNSTVPFTANDPENPAGPLEPPDPDFSVPGKPLFAPNSELVREDFPLNGWFNPTAFVPRGLGVSLFEELDNVDSDTNDVVSSMGVRRTQFLGVVRRSAVEDGLPLPDIFNVITPGRLNLDGRVRRVEPRNAPPVINAVFNFDNFWDGRASFVFNGVNPFGFRDRTSTLKINRVVNGVSVMRDVFVRVTNSSLASQAVGPPLSDFEMSFAGRTFPDIGKKMLSLRPLAKQVVSPEDSVLGSLAVPGRKGLNTSYIAMIQAAFRPPWWNSRDIITVETGTAALQMPSAGNPRTAAVAPGSSKVTKSLKAAADLAPNQYTQMMYNFSLFWGLAVQAYQATLISDDAPFDRFMGAPSLGIAGDPTALTAQEQLGLNLFIGSGTCSRCHVTPITTGHTVLDANPDEQGVPSGLEGIIEFMNMGDGEIANYDHGMYNISVRRTTEDLGRAGTAPDAPPFRNPLDDNKPFPLSYVELTALKSQGKLPPDVARFVPTLSILDRRVTRGAFKVPNLRNGEFTGPYFHNGDSATLRQVVEFYARGGNFPNTNFRELTVDMNGVPDLMFPEFIPNTRQNVEALVAFIANGLTDQRVAFERAPFDHPQLFVPNGSPEGAPEGDIMLEIPAVGKNGRETPISRFLNLDPQDPGA